MSEQNGNVLLRFYKDWREAEQRLQMAQQSLLGAQGDLLVKEARFKGAAELLHGADAAFEYSEASGLTFSRPNREVRRALAKAKKKR